MSNPCPADLSQVIDDVDVVIQSCGGQLDALLEERDRNNIRDQVTAVALTRILKYAAAFVLLARNGYGEPAACLLRSLFDGYLWIRRSVLTDKNAGTYFNAGKGEGIRQLQKLMSSGLGVLKDRVSGSIPGQETIQRMLKDELKGSYPPTWTDMAKGAGLSDLFVLVYPLLSGMAHGNLLFFGERMERATVSPNANWDNIEPLLPLAHNLVLDSFRVTEHWMRRREILPLPQWASREFSTRPAS